MNVEYGICYWVSSKSYLFIQFSLKQCQKIGKEKNKKPLDFVNRIDIYMYIYMYRIHTCTNLFGDHFDRYHYIISLECQTKVVAFIGL